MRNIIGQPARGKDFYERTREITVIIDSLANGNNIQITAPRRVGKTSILWYLLDNDVDDRHYVYIDTESIDDEEGFYKKLLSTILHNKKISGSTKIFKAFTDKSDHIFKKLKSIKILNSGIDFNHDEVEKDYYQELTDFLTGYAREEDSDLVILVDEFPQTIENIKKKDEEKARKFLQNNRVLRLNPDLNGKIHFIYTGSIGLNYTVSKLNATAFINDLNSIEVGPLGDTEAGDLFQKLLKTNRRSVREEATRHFLNIIQWYIPFHIQLIVQELIRLSTPNREIQITDIDKAINSIIDLRNQNHFDHYHSRLRSQFKDNAYRYADEILKEMAQKDRLSKTDVLETAVKYELGEDYRRIIETLIYDGYIHYDSATQNYVFNSPIVKLWWLKFIC